MSGRGGYDWRKHVKRGGGGGRGRGNGGGGYESQENSHGGVGGGGGYDWRKHVKRPAQEEPTNEDGSKFEDDEDQPAEKRFKTNILGNKNDLLRTLQRLDGKGYKAYRDLEGGWQVEPWGLLFIDHTQSDPFAAPSRLRFRVAMSTAGFPKATYSNTSRLIALSDFLARTFARLCKDGGHDVYQSGGHWGSAKGGHIEIDMPSQHILQRDSIKVCSEYVEVRFGVGLPAQGRSILGQWAGEILTGVLPALAQAALCFQQLDQRALVLHLQSAEDQDALRSMLEPAGLIGFVADGSILPRKSGADDRPLPQNQAVPFRSPESLKVSFDLPNLGTITGMGIKRGVTLIVGGGFHGKSTLLRALEVGCYNHIPGDGREFVSIVPDAVKIRAEDGRSVVSVDISPFISNLPFDLDTTTFTTPNASGSTSQSSNIMEALELGATTLLLDEDTCATNFMIRDRRMQQLVAKEPITPYITRIRQLFESHGVSTILVAGGSGDYIEAADCVVLMEDYVPHDVTQPAKDIALSQQSVVAQEAKDANFLLPQSRIPISVVDHIGGRFKVKTSTASRIQFGPEQEIDLSAVEQIVDKSQTRAIADSLLYLQHKYMNGRRSLKEMLESLDAEFDNNGLDILLSVSFLSGQHARPRRFEIAAALNRIRSLNISRRP